MVYHGSAAGLGAEPAWKAEGNHANSYLGWSVGTAGDVNGDGYADALAGASYLSSGEAAEGAVFFYYGNAQAAPAGNGGGLHLRPRQVRTDGRGAIPRLGNSNARAAFALQITARTPMGRDDARMEWQVAPLGTLLTSTRVISGTTGWTDVMTGGVTLSQEVTGLAPLTVYHWRVRLVYRPGNPLGQAAGPWLTRPWAGWNEADLRTPLNGAPLADAGADQSVPPLATVTLDGSGSDDPDGDLPLAYRWTQTAGAPVGLSDATAVAPTFTAPAETGVLSFALVVTDSLGLRSTSPGIAAVRVWRGEVYLPLVWR